jgi:tetratricopeptide (TPR) repeat protein
LRLSPASSAGENLHRIERIADRGLAVVRCLFIGVILTAGCQKAVPPDPNAVRGRTVAESLGYREPLTDAQAQAVAEADRLIAAAQECLVRNENDTAEAKAMRAEATTPIRHQTARAAFILGHVASRRNQMRAAVAHFTDAIDADATNPAFYYARAVCKAELLGKRRVDRLSAREEITADLDRAVKLDPGYKDKADQLRAEIDH